MSGMRRENNSEKTKQKYFEMKKKKNTNSPPLYIYTTPSNPLEPVSVRFGFLPFKKNYSVFHLFVFLKFPFG
jgi:hypothetical protein